MCIKSLICNGPIWRLCPATGIRLLIFSLLSLLSGNPLLAAGDSMRSQMEADWLRQARSWAAASQHISETVGDAAGAVDGVKNGK